MDREKVIGWLTMGQDFLQKLFSAFCTSIDRFSDTALLLMISGFYFVWRILSLPHFEYSGDAVYKWQFLRYYYETGTWFPKVLEHHQGRWCQNLPVYGLMKLFGTTDPWVGCIIPILTGFGVLLLVYLITRQIAPKHFALLAAGGVLLNNVFADESVQFLPDLPSAFYVLLSLYILLRYLKKPEALYLPLLAGLTMGLAWGCKVTSVYWCVGIGLFLCFFPVPGKTLFTWKKFRLGWDVLLFSLAFFCVFAVEFAVLHHFFADAKLGRISFLMVQHGSSLNRGIDKMFTIPEYIFAPFVIFLDPRDKAVDTYPRLLLFLFALPVMILFLREKTLALTTKFLVFALFVVFLLHCFLATPKYDGALDFWHKLTFNHPERPLNRYFLTMTCAAFILVFPGWQALLAKLKEKSPLLHLAGRIVCELLVLSLFIFGMMYFFIRPLLHGDNLYNKVWAYHCISEQRIGDLPLLVQYKKTRNGPNIKTVLAMQTFFGPVQDLPALPGKKDDQLVCTPDNSFLINGDRYYLIMGKQPLPGETFRCMVIKDERFFMTELTRPAEGEQK